MEKNLNQYRTAAYENLKNNIDYDYFDPENEYTEIEGRWIIHIKTLGKNLKCCSCKSILSLEKITGEKRCALASIFYIKCNAVDCGVVTQVYRDKKHKVNRQEFIKCTRNVNATLYNLFYEELNIFSNCNVFL